MFILWEKSLTTMFLYTFKMERLLLLLSLILFLMLNLKR